jgi:hypothetical protein
MLAPIYNPVDRMVPPSFPLLLVAPGIAIDLIMQRFGKAPGFWRNWLVAGAMGAAFLAAFLAAQYPFAGFLISPAADNWIFAGNHWVPYFARPGDWRTRFWDTEKDALTVAGLAVALAFAIVKSRIALAVGAWMSKVQR